MQCRASAQVDGLPQARGRVGAQINYANKAMLVGALIVAGWDAARGGQVYGVPIGGTLVRQRWTTDGSGSTYLWGYLDAEYKRAPPRAVTQNPGSGPVAGAVLRRVAHAGLLAGAHRPGTHSACRQELSRSWPRRALLAPRAWPLTSPA